MADDDLIIQQIGPALRASQETLRHLWAIRTTLRGVSLNRQQASILLEQLEIVRDDIRICTMMTT